MRNRQRQDSKSRSTQRKIFVILVSWCLCVGFLSAQTTVNINDTLRNADNTLASGRLEIFWAAFKTSDGFTVAPGRLSYTVTNGVVNLSLFPNAGGTPSGTSYRVDYYLTSGAGREYWVVPATGPVTIGDIRVSVAPSPAVAVGIGQLPAGSANQLFKTNTGGGGGHTITVNGSALASSTAADFDDATPAAPANGFNVKWQKDALDPTNISGYFDTTTWATSTWGSGSAITFTYNVGAVDPVLALTTGNVKWSGATTYTYEGGATDPVWTPGNGVMNLSTGTLQQGGNAVETQNNKNAASGYAGLTAGTKLTVAQGQEVWALADLTDVTATTGSGTTAVLGTSPTLAGTPVVGDGAGNDKLEFAEETTNPTCAAGQYFV